MEKQNIQLTSDEMIAVAKSLSIGIDQVARKLSRFRGTEQQSKAINKELSLLMSARSSIEETMRNTLGEQR